MVGLTCAICTVSRHAEVPLVSISMPRGNVPGHWQHGCHGLPDIYRFHPPGDTSPSAVCPENGSIASTPRAVLTKTAPTDARQEFETEIRHLLTTWSPIGEIGDGGRRRSWAAAALLMLIGRPEPFDMVTTGLRHANAFHRLHALLIV
jgi:hypothetical protein